MEPKKGYAIILVSVFIIAGMTYGVFLFLNNTSRQTITLATTTSVDNTGLLEYLIDYYEDQQQTYAIKYIPVGSGAAIQLGRDGEVDAVLVHAPSLEQELIDEGYVLNKTTLWYNYFILIGPASDPAGIASATNVTEVFELIYNAGESGTAVFYSRGDESGTHTKEKIIWSTTQYGIPTGKSWYYETTSGMSSTIVTADEQNPDRAYVLTDLGTFAKLLDSDTPISLVELYGQDEQLYNPYSYLIINENKFSFHLNTKGAQSFLDFLTAPKTQQLVNDYTVGGVILFTPVATVVEAYTIREF